MVVVNRLDDDRARPVGEMAAAHGWSDDLPTAHAAACAIERGWPLVTAHPDRYASASTRMTVEELP